MAMNVRLHADCIEISGCGRFADVEALMKSNDRKCFVLNDCPDFRDESYDAGYQTFMACGSQVGFEDPALCDEFHLCHDNYCHDDANALEAVRMAFAERDSKIGKARKLGHRTHADDLQQIVMHEIILENGGGGKLKALRPFRINPYFLPKTCESSDEHYGFLYPRLSMSGLADSRRDLIDLIEAHIEFAWLQYAEEDDSKLTPDAADLGRRMRETFERS